MSTSSSTSQLDATLNALQGGLSSAAGAASGNIQGWITTLQGNPQLSGISSELKKLDDAIASGDSSSISSSLKTLGEHTTKAASSATPDAQDKLMKLGQTLSSAATQLKG
jgi:hypothetical protein